MEGQTVKLSRIEKVEADIDLRITEILAALGEFDKVPPRLFKSSCISAYQLGESHAKGELTGPDDLINGHGYRRGTDVQLPLWHLIEVDSPSNQEIADYIENFFSEDTGDFRWPDEPIPYDHSLVFIRCCYGVAYACVDQTFRDKEEL